MLRRCPPVCSTKLCYHSSNPRIRDPFFRWCGRRELRGFSLSRLAIIRSIRAED
ncbi:hypothetical protein Cenrod_0160 [Candidatus Symbiobacter mobilis CR]|uniref:Uncharacterized protein n=1 Tax=Candidatus Symbiobacter mobilis CR TaxID=946483 RepID=U5N4M7_9BURK|nr:hypothetical protein Cenrod_0160 [Candidatus Symbiobacter mobilis CR]